MSFRNFQENDLTARTLENSVSLTPWVRNPSWPALPSVLSTDEKFVGLYAVYPESAFAAFIFNTSSGTYTVDWGDGTTSTVASGSTAQRQYDFTDTDLANTNAPVTFTDSGDTVDRTAHGYTDGMTISFASITTTTGIVPGQIYYVVNAAANTFQLSATLGGSVLPLTNDGSGIILPYKIATVVVTPTTSGATLTTINLNVRNTTTGLQLYSTGWLDITFASSATSMTFSGSTVVGGITSQQLEQVTILRHNSTNLTNMFLTCSLLQSVPLFDTSSVTNMTTMFEGCRSLQSVPAFNTASVTNMFSMFLNCSSLVTVPLFNTASVTTMRGMFEGCSSLVTIPLFNTASVTTMTLMFSGCTSLQSVPLFNTSSVTVTESMFRTCSSLVTVPLFNTSSVTSLMTSMFNGCTSLQSVPLFNTASVTSMTGMFSNCTSLQSVPLFNTASVTGMTSMFNGCTSLQSVPLFNTASVTSMTSMFLNCSSLVTVPLFNTAAVTNMRSMFEGCSSLVTIPLFNTASVTNMSSMFQDCTSLQSVPALNTAAVTGSSTTTGFNSMFSGCSALQTIAEINFNRAGVTTSSSYTSMFATCRSLSSAGTTSGPRLTHSLTACKFSPAALNAWYTALPTVTAQTVTVTNNWGNASDTPSIATAKGWTVTG